MMPLLKKNPIRFAYKKACYLIISLYLLSHPAGLISQDASFFRANGKNVAIESFNKEVIQMMEDLGVPGLSLAIIENNEIAFYQPYGVKKSGEPEKVNAKTVFNGCSLSKSLLVFVVMQLVDEAKLDLDKPMYQYLENERLKYDLRYKTITPRMILSHSSGIENWQYDHEPSVLEILSPPGENYVYSGEGYNYLAKVVEGILGQPYSTYIKERVLIPLNLENTFLEYEEASLNAEHETTPWNYATGHGIFGEHLLNNNADPNPAAGVHFTAEDYAKLFISIFDTSQLSTNRIEDLKQSLTKIDLQVYYGPGFQVIKNEKDIIIAHGGNNPGYKNWIFYSLTSKRGIVMLTNSDRGELMVTQLSKLSVGLDLSPFMRSWSGFTDQYPSNATSLFKVFNEKGSEEMFAELDKLKAEHNISASSLSTLSYLFLSGGDLETAEKLLRLSISEHPDAFLAYFFLGAKYFYEGDHITALQHFLKAKELGYAIWDLDFFIEQSQSQIEKTEER